MTEAKEIPAFLYKPEELKQLPIQLQKEFEKKKEEDGILPLIIKIYEDVLSNKMQLEKDQKLQATIFGDFTNDLVNAITKLTSFPFPSYKKLIQKLIRTILAVLLKYPHNKDLILSARSLFDPENCLYRLAMSEMMTDTIYKPSVSEAEEKQFRESLKIGQKVDCLRRETFQGDTVEAWAPGEIKEIRGECLSIFFEGISSYEKSIEMPNSNRLAMYKTRTKGWEWRQALKAGDELDCLDTARHWYRSTVLEVRKIKNKEQGEESEVCIGFRVFLPEGIKRDHTGKHYEGWSDTYDEWVNINSLRLQKPGLITKIGTVYCKKSLDDESPAPDDSNDILLNFPLNDDKIYFVHRYGRCSTPYFLELMTWFTNEGGFKNIMKYSLEFMKPQITAMVPQAEPMMPLTDIPCQNNWDIETLFAYIELLASPYQLYHRLFIIEFFCPFIQEIISYVSNLPDSQLRKAKREKLDTALNQLEVLMRRVFTNKTKGEQSIRLRVGIALSLLRSELLERRIQAIRMLGDTCRSAKDAQTVNYQVNMPTKNDSAVLSALLQVPKVIEEIFGKRSHIQLIQRSTEIIKFFLTESNITKSDFSVIWECCEHDEQSKVEIFKVLSDTSIMLPNELTEILIANFISKPKASLKDKDVELIIELGSKYSRLPLQLTEEILNLLWDLCMGLNTSVSEAMVLKGMDKFCDVITTFSIVPQKVMNGYFDKLYVLIASSDKSIMALKILRNCLRQIPCINQTSNRVDVCEQFLKSGNVMDNFYIDIINCHNIKTELQKNNKPINVAQHKKDMEERIEFLSFCARNAKYKFNKNNLDTLFKIMVIERIINDDQNLFFSMIKDLLINGKPEEYFFPPDELIKFFETTICSEEFHFQTLTLEGMQAIETMLISVYTMQGYIVLPAKSFAYQGGSALVYGPNLPVSEYGSVFKVKAMPTEMKSMKVLWKIVLESTLEAVTSRAIELLKKLYTKLSSEIEDKISEISSQFIETAIEKIDICWEIMKKKENKRLEINKLLKLIDEMLDESEKKGNGGLIPTDLLGVGNKINVRFSNFGIEVGVPGPNFIDILLHSHVTIWQAKILIGEKLQISPGRIRFQFGQNDIPENASSKSLEEMKIGDNDVVKVLKKHEDDSMKEPLLNKDQYLSDKALEVFKEVFARFSAEGKMTKAHAAKFTEAALGSQVPILESDYHVENLFSKYDTEKKGFITLDSFLLFYLEACSHNESVVRNNLHELKYNPDLTRMDSEKAERMALSLATKLPRYILPNKEKYFNFLLKLLSLGGNVTSAVWELLMKLAPNETIMNQLLNIFALKDTTGAPANIDWESLFGYNNLYQSTYALRLVLYLIEDLPNKELYRFIREGVTEERKLWKENFFKKGGVVWIIKYMPSLSRYHFVDQIEQTYLDMLISIVGKYYASSLAASKKFLLNYDFYGFEPKKEENKADDSYYSLGKSNYKKSIFKRPLAEEYLMTNKDLIALMSNPEVQVLLTASFIPAELAKLMLHFLEELQSPDHEATNYLQALTVQIGFLIKFLFASTINMYKELLAFKENPCKILIQGLLSKKSSFFRENYQALIFFLCANFSPAEKISTGYSTNTTYKGTILYETLLILMNTEIYLKEADCWEACELLTALLNKIEHNSIDQHFNTNEQLNDLQNLIINYVPKETQLLSNNDYDKGLVSILKISAEIYSKIYFFKRPSTEYLFKFIDYIFFSCLFPIKESPDKIMNFKCKSLKSREAAFNLITSLAGYNDEANLYIMKELILPLSTKTDEITTWGFTFDKEERASTGYVGIKNLGCICYMNSVLQQLFMVMPFRNAILSVQDNKPPVCNNVFGIDDSTLHQLQLLFGFLLKSNRREYNPMRFTFSFKERDGKPINTGIQKDATEFLNDLFDKLEKSLKDTPYKNLVQSLFQGKTCGQVQCKECGKINTNYQEIYSLQLEVKNQRNFSEAMERFIAGTEVTGYMCEECNKRVTAVKRTILSSLPSILFVHLERFTYNFDNEMNEKIHTRFEFPNNVNLLPYTEEGTQEENENSPSKPEEGKKEIKQIPMQIAKTDSKEEPTQVEYLKLHRKQSELEAKEKESHSGAAEKKKATNKKKEKKDPDYYTYKLVGVVVHNGNADSGHYYSYINVNERTNWELSREYLNTEKDKWLAFDDSYVKDFDFKNLANECFGGSVEDSGAMGIDDAEANRFFASRSKSAYMLIYERKLKSMIPEKLPPEASINIKSEDVVLDSLDCTGTAIPRVENMHLAENGALGGAVPMSIGSEVAQRNYYAKNTKANELYKLHPFYNVPISILPFILEETTKDNIKLLYEKLCYQIEFIKFVRTLVSNSSCSYKTSVNPIITKELHYYCLMIGIKFLLNIFPHLANAENYSYYLKENIAEVACKYPDHAEIVLQKYISEPQKIFDLLITCPEQQLHAGFCEFLIKVFSAKFKVEEELWVYSKAEPMDISNKATAMVISQGGQVSHASSVASSASSSSLPIPTTQLFLDKMLAFLKTKELLEAWTKFQYYFECIKEIFIRNQSLKLVQYAHERDLTATLLDFILEKKSPINQNPKRIEMGSYAAQPDLSSVLPLVAYLVKRFKEMPDKFPISNNTLLCLHSEELINKHLSSKGGLENFTDTILDFCKNDKKYSKLICRFMLKIINDYDPNKIAPYFGLLSGILAIEDKLQDLRIEWILGFAQPFSEKVLGLSLISYYSFEGDINKYVSPLCITTYNYPLLWQLWKIRQRSDYFVLQSIAVLFQIVTKYEKLYQFMKLVPSPDYVHARYSDWIVQFVNDFPKVTSIMGVTTEQKEKTYSDAVIGVSKYKSKIEEEKEASNPTQNYIIGLATKEEELKDKQLWSNEGWELRFIEITTEIYESKPNGTTNLAISLDYIKNHFRSKETSSNYDYDVRLESFDEKKKKFEKLKKARKQQMEVHKQELVNIDESIAKLYPENKHEEDIEHHKDETKKENIGEKEKRSDEVEMTEMNSGESKPGKIAPIAELAKPEKKQEELPKKINEESLKPDKKQEEPPKAGLEKMKDEPPKALTEKITEEFFKPDKKQEEPKPQRAEMLVILPPPKIEVKKASLNEAAGRPAPSIPETQNSNNEFSGEIGINMDDIVIKNEITELLNEDNKKLKEDNKKPEEKKEEEKVPTTNAAATPIVQPQPPVLPPPPPPYKELPSLIRIEVHAKAAMCHGTAKIKIVPKNGSKLNFYYPQSNIKITVSGYDQTILMLQKNNINEPWGDFDVIFKVKLSKESNYYQGNPNNLMTSNAPYQRMNEKMNDPLPPPGPIAVPPQANGSNTYPLIERSDAPTSVPSIPAANEKKGAAPAIAIAPLAPITQFSPENPQKTKACAACTSWNFPNATECEVCDTRFETSDTRFSC